MKISIVEIQIGERQRIELGDPLNDLASIGDPEVGLINPITVEKLHEAGLGDGYKYKLLAGRRRLEYHIRSGKTEIEATIRGQSTELVRQKIELLEDIERKDRSWQEECLAFSKLFNLIRLEKAAQNQSWTVRAMARFTKTDKSIVHYSLEIAKFLKTEPRDEEMWKSSNYTEALKLVIDRNYKLANDELEVRRQRWQVQEAAAREVTGATGASHETTIIEELPDSGFVASLPGPVENQDTTPVKTKVFIHGLNIDFAKAVPGLHFMEGMALAVLGWKPGGIIANVSKALHQDGWAIMWYDGPLNNNVLDWFCTLGHNLIWNRIAIDDKEVTTPFVNNYVEAIVIAKHAHDTVNPNPSGSVISCLPEGDELPYPVVDWCLRPIALPNSAVLCPVNAPVLYVAMSGYIPIWFEADKAKFDAKVQQLKDYYMDNIPNCRVMLRKVDSEGDWTSEPI